MKTVDGLRVCQVMSEDTKLLIVVVLGLRNSV